MNGRAARLAWVPAAVAMLCGVVPSGAQVPGDPAGMPQLRLPGSAAPAPAVADTATADIALLAGGIPTTALRVEPDSVAFGDIVWLVAEGPQAAAADTLALPEWLEPAAGARGGPSGRDLVAVPVRVYRVDPFRVRCGNLVSAPVTVLGAGPGAEGAPVRDPRGRGWYWGLLVALVAGALLLALLLGRVRLRRAARVTDRAVPDVPWPGFAASLEAALDDLAQGGDARGFANRLAGIGRAYAGSRFGIAGREMTGTEIAAACRRLGFPSAVGRGFARAIDELDLRRYDPAPPSEGWVRDLAAQLLVAVAAVRIPLDDQGLPPAVALEAAARWERLEAALGRRGGEAA